MPDFTMRPDFVITEAPEHSTLISKFENGVEQRRNKWSSALRKWTLVFKAKTQAEFETIRDFFNTKKGAYSSFTWVNINDNVTYTVRFEKDSLDFNRLAYNVYDFECNFIQVK